MKPLDNALDHARRSAVTLLRDRKKTLKLVESAGKRLTGKSSPSAMRGLVERVRAASRMVRSSVNREYGDVPWQSLVLVTAALVYFVSPVDALADFIPLLGFADDAAIVGAVIASIGQDLDRFLEWEKEQG